MAACPHKFELKQNLVSTVGWRTLENLSNLGLTIAGACPQEPECTGWAIAEAGRRALDLCHVQEGAVLMTPDQCRQARKLLS
jgi:hypothetical protein